METFIFDKLPENVDELKCMSEITLDSAYKTAALTLAVLANFEKSADTTFAMLDVLKGPEPLSAYEKQFIKDRLTGKNYKVFSFFKGACADNGYTPSLPFTISVEETPNSFAEENWATVYVKSSGADSPRPIKLRRKPSTGQWFLNEIMCLADIVVPKADDPWA